MPSIIYPKYKLSNLSGSDWKPDNNFSTDVRSQLSAGSNLTYVGGQFAVVASPSFTSVTASNGITGSFKGDGSKITNITASNIDNFTSDVRLQLSAGSGLTYDKVNGIFSLGGVGTDTNTSTITGLTASNEAFIACSGTTTDSVINVQLPLISDIGNGKNYVIKNIGIGTINILPSGSDKIDNALSASIYTRYSSYSLFGSASNWWIY